MKRTTLAAVALALTLPAGMAQAQSDTVADQGGTSGNGMSGEQEPMSGNAMTGNAMSGGDMRDSQMSLDNGMSSGGMSSNEMNDDPMSGNRMTGNSMSGGGEMSSDNAMGANGMSANDMNEDPMSGNSMSGNTMSGGVMGEEAGAGTSADMMEPKTSQAGIQYISGGTGDQSQDQMKQVAEDYSLHVMTISGQAYVSDVDVSIKDGNGETLLEDSAKGPMLYVDLEPGTYTVMGDLDGETSTQQVEVSDNGASTVRLNFPNAQ